MALARYLERCLLRIVNGVDISLIRQKTFAYVYVPVLNSYEQGCITLSVSGAEAEPAVLLRLQPHELAVVAASKHA